MGSMQKQESKSKLMTQEFPGVYGTPESARIASMAEGMIGQRPASPLQAMLMESLGGAPTQAETALTQAAANVAGVSPESLGDILSSSQLQTRGGGIAELMHTLGTQQAGALSQRQMALQGLLELAGLAMPQIIAGQKTTAKGGPSTEGLLGYGTGYNIAKMMGG